MTASCGATAVAAPALAPAVAPFAVCFVVLVVAVCVCVGFFLFFPRWHCRLHIVLLPVRLCVRVPGACHVCRLNDLRHFCQLLLPHTFAILFLLTGRMTVCASLSLCVCY